MGALLRSLGLVYLVSIALVGCGFETRDETEAGPLADAFVGAPGDGATSSAPQDASQPQDDVSHAGRPPDASQPPDTDGEGVSDASQPPDTDGEGVSDASHPTDASDASPDATDAGCPGLDQSCLMVPCCRPWLCGGRGLCATTIQ